MQHNDSDAKRLVGFCARLPAIAGEFGEARTETLWVIEQFKQRRAQLHGALARSTSQHERPSLRCEIDALDTACSVLHQVWQRRFGAPLGG